MLRIEINIFMTFLVENPSYILTCHDHRMDFIGFLWTLLRI